MAFNSGNVTLSDDARLPDEKLEQAIRDALEPGERVLWTGYPKQGLLFRAQDALFVPFSMLWGGFAVFWETSVISSHAPFFFMLWGVPFVAVGLHMIFGRFFTDAWLRRRTIYAVTEQRVIILTQSLQQRMRSLELAGLAEINISDHGNGSGTIVFGPSVMAGFMRGWPGSARNLPPAFERIPRAQDVLRTIRDAQKTLARRTAA